MKIAILQTGKTNPAMPSRFQDYPALFTKMFASDPRAAKHSFATVTVVDGEMLSVPLPTGKTLSTLKDESDVANAISIFLQVCT